MDPFSGRQNEEQVFEIIREPDGEAENGGEEEDAGEEYGYSDFLNDYGDGMEVEQERNDNCDDDYGDGIDCDDGSENSGPSEVY